MVGNQSNRSTTLSLNLWKSQLETTPLSFPRKIIFMTMLSLQILKEETAESHNHLRLKRTHILEFQIVGVVRIKVVAGIFKINFSNEMFCSRMLAGARGILLFFPENRNYTCTFETYANLFGHTNLFFI